MNSSFTQKVKEGKPLIGIIQTLSAPEITEIIDLAGFDWVFIDLEHGPLTIESAKGILQVGGHRLPGIVRVPLGEEPWIKRVLDIGPAGIIVPQVNSAEQAEKIVKQCKYPPRGIRGVGLARAQGYGLKFEEYITTANDNLMVILQIEHIDAVNNIEDIVKVPGIDALFIGPYDLSGSMGKIGKVKDADVQEKIAHVRRVCGEAGMSLGIFTGNPGDVNGLKAAGYSLITLGIDTMFMGRMLKEALQQTTN